FASEKLLRHAGPDHDRAGKLFALHGILDSERGDDHERLPGIVPFTVPGRSFDQLLAVGDARFLRSLRQTIDIAAERDYRMTRAPARDPCGRHPRDAALDGKAVLLEHAGQIFGGLEFLVTEFAETEDGVVHHLRKFAPTLDTIGHGRFEFLDPCRVQRRALL